MKKLLRDILILAGLLLMGISTVRPVMGWISERRVENDAWWGVHKAVNGDLVGMAYLDKVPQFHSARDYVFTRHPVETGRNDLYVWGDSYIWKVPDSAYAAVRYFRFGWRYREDIAYRLNDTQNNILLIEVSERYVRQYLAGTDMFRHVYGAGGDKHPVSRDYTEEREGINTPGFLNKHINQNLEFNLFNYNFINPIRHWKAAMNYHMFRRASGDVVLSGDGRQLYLRETVAGTNNANSYYPLEDGELEQIIHTLNALQAHYVAEGFDEVYLSILPNPATIMEPEGYNQLIPLVERHPGLRMKVISVYDEYHRQTRRIYRPGDTHWNNEGLQIWLRKVNEVLLERQATAPNRGSRGGA
ncbi:MAG: hypothetical protein JNL72_04140 [Flavipsychrobacter sp.]|nr:hypothetical protein [Flavipsychrobacter sp.]